DGCRSDQVNRIRAATETDDVPAPGHELRLRCPGDEGGNALRKGSGHRRPPPPPNACPITAEIPSGRVLALKRSVGSVSQSAAAAAGHRRCSVSSRPTRTTCSRPAQVETSESCCLSSQSGNGDLRE